jgi:hypothetical protein
MKTMLILLLLSSQAFADDVTIHSLTRGKDQTAKELTVTFSDTSIPSKSDATKKENWSAQCVQTSKPSTNLDLDHITSAKDFESDPFITLFFSNTTDSCQAVHIIFLVGKFPSATWFTSSQKDTSTPSIWSKFFGAVTEKDTAAPDYSLSFTWAPAVGSSPVYTIDGSIQHRFVSGPPSFSFVAIAKSDSSKKADPDSFNWALQLARGGLNGFGWRSKFIGMEFDKAGNAMNSISEGDIAWRYFHDILKPDNSLAFSWSILFRGGVEIGDNFKNEFTIANKPNQRGTGVIFRGVPSARFAFALPTDAKHTIKFNSNYTVRLPAQEELFLETRHVKDPVPGLGTNPRPYLENNLTFNLTDFFAFTVQHSYGSLPPAFKFTDHKGSVGIVFQAKQPR